VNDLLSLIENEILRRNIRVLVEHLSNVKNRYSDFMSAFKTVLEKRSLLSLVEENGTTANEQNFEDIVQVCADIFCTAIHVRTKNGNTKKAPSYALSNETITVQLPMKDKAVEVMSELFGVSLSLLFSS